MLCMVILESKQFEQISYTTVIHIPLANLNIKGGDLMVECGVLCGTAYVSLSNTNAFMFLFIILQYTCSA